MNIEEYQHYHEKKNHSNDSFLCNIYPCSIPCDFNEVPLHWHDDVEFLSIKKGSGIIVLDFISYSVSAGDFFVILPGKLHAIRCNDSSMEYENILFDKGIFQSYSPDFCYEEFLSPFFDGSLPFSHPHITASASIYSELTFLVARLDNISCKRPFGYQLAMKGLLSEILFLLISPLESALAPGQHSGKTQKLKLVLKYMEEHYQQPISIEDMAKLTQYSKSHFMKFFKAQMGISFITYLNDYRLTMAARQLRHSSSPVIDTAVGSGFDNLSYFNRLFRKKYGMTPGQYKRMD